MNADGSYALNKYCDSPEAGTTHNASAIHFTQYKSATINNQVNSFVANNNTKFLVLDDNGYTYTLYNGINELPSMTVAASDLCFLTDGTYATLVVIKAKTLDSSEFVAYAATQNGFATGYNPIKYAYTVTKLGSTEATTLYATAQNLFKADGFYKITLAADGTIAAVANNPTQLLEGYGYDAANLNTSYDGAHSTAADLYWDRTKVEKFEGDSLVGAGYGDYRVNSSTEYYVVTKTQYSDSTEITEITKGDINSVATDDVVVIGYTSKNAVDSVDNVASYVYVMKLVSQGQVTPSTTGTINYYVTFKNSTGNVIAENVLVATQVVKEGTYNAVNWNFLSRAMVAPTSAPGTFTVVNSYIPAADYAKYGCADTYNLTVEGGSTYPLYYTATLIG